jgi:hypothetical protein
MLKESIERSEAMRVEQRGSQTEPVSYIRCATRLLAIVGGIYRACGLTMLGPPQSMEIPELPSWAGNICEQLARTIFKRLAELRPEGEQADWRNTGRMLGVWQRIITFLADAWKNGERVLPEEALAPSTAPADSFVVIPQSDLLQSVQESLKNQILESFLQNPAEQEEFFAGLHEGHKMFLDTNGQLVGDRGRTQVYLVLLGNWMEIEEMRKGRPSKTCLDLYEMLAPSLGDPHRERFEWFNDVCNGIGLCMKTPGRPRKNPRK